MIIIQVNHRYFTIKALYYYYCIIILLHNIMAKWAAARAGQAASLQGWTDNVFSDCGGRGVKAGKKLVVTKLQVKGVLIGRW